MMTNALRRLSLPVLLLALALATPSLHAQDGLKSVDLGAALKTFVQSVKQANATDAASTAKQHAARQLVTNLHARITATNSTAEEQFGAHVQALEISTDAALARLAAVRRTATLLSTAREALAGARRGLGMSAASEATALPSPAEEKGTDARLGDFVFAEGDVDRELVEANQAAKDFYANVTHSGGPGANVKEALGKAEQKLRAYEARTVRELVRAEAALSRLEVQAAQGLAGVATLTLAANTLELSFESLPFLPLPQVATPGTAPAPFATDKVPAKSAFTR